MVFGWFPLFFKVVSWFFMVLIGFHGFSRWFHGFMVFGWFPLFSGWFHGLSWFLLVSMVFQGGFMVFYGLWLVSMVLLVKNTTKLYPGPTIWSRLWPSHTKCYEKWKFIEVKF